jgi:hypothetical protein
MYEVKRAYTEKDGFERPNGWHLFHNGNWCQWFWLKRDALTAKRELEEQEKQ